MQTYLVVRRSAWSSLEQQCEADARSAFEAARMEEEIASIQSYPLEESDRRIGSICVYEASSPEAVPPHAAAAFLPVDEIVKVVDPAPVRADEAGSTSTRKEGSQ